MTAFRLLVTTYAPDNAWLGDGGSMPAPSSVVVVFETEADALTACQRLAQEKHENFRYVAVPLWWPSAAFDD